MNRYLPLILIGVLLNAAAQLLLKVGMRTIGEFSFDLRNVIPIGVKVVSSNHIILGISCYVISAMVWLLVLSRVEVSFAYPFLSIGYIVAALGGQTLLGEELTITRWAGIFVICIGVYLITRTG